MKLLIAICVLLGLSLAHEYDEAWAAWKVKYSKQYETEVEEVTRKAIWLEHLKEVTQHNLEADLGMHTYWQEMNSLTDMTNAEYRATLLGFVQSARDPEVEVNDEVDGSTPIRVDWNAEGYVTPVKDQGQCGSGWSFSTSGATESACAIKKGKRTLISLSEEELVDCDTKSDGCNGGDYGNGFSYYTFNGAASESAYPYISGTDNNTHTCQEFNPVRYVSSHAYTKSGSEKSLKVAVASQPVSVAVDASLKSFQRYSGGLYYTTKCSTNILNHAMLVTGYSDDAEGKFWIVKNSWGTGWGIQGYIWMARDQGNMCGIATNPCYPTCK